MAKGRIGFRLLACLTLFAGVSQAHAAPTVAQMLEYKPRQVGVNISTPGTSELSTCKVELTKENKLANGKTPSAWVLKDGAGKLLRRFKDSAGDGKVDVYAYYLDGRECYREIDSNLDGQIDQYRWLGPNGGKWGVDLNQDGRIDTWKAISVEEASQEILQAVQSRDYGRLQALMINKAELDALELPDSEANRIRNVMQKAPEKFQKTTAALIAMSGKAKWVHLETDAPECLAADTVGSKIDVIRYKHGTILYQNGEKHDFLQTGEMIQVGRAWRLIDAPAPGSRVERDENGPRIDIPDSINGLVQKLQKVDANAPKTSDPKETVRYNLERAAVLEEIVASLQGDQREPWIKQLVDCLSSAAQNNPSDKKPLEKMAAIQKVLAKETGSNNIAAYVQYRAMSTEYTMMLSSTKSGDMAKVQESWKESLAKFVSDYPTAEDTPEALMQLGMVNEFMGKETEAKNWYKQLADNFKQHAYAPKAQGALRRLNLEGQEYDLTGNTLGSGNPFDIKSLKGKVVVVYYWASWNGQSADDFKRLKSTMSVIGSKGVELVCVNLDNSPAEAINFIKNNPMPGTHLHQQGGLDSGLAQSYGVMVLPTTFIIDTNGKVANRNAQIATLEDDVKKLIK